MKKISKKFNWILMISICLSVLLSTVLTTAMMILRTQKEMHERNKIQIESLVDNIEGFFANAFNLNYQLSLNPLIVNTILTADKNWESRKNQYRLTHINPQGDLEGISLLSRLVQTYPWVDLFYVQDKDGFQTARSSGMIASRNDRWWYKEFLGEREKQPFISQSYFSMKDNKPVASVFHPVYSGDGFIGIMGTDINFTSLQTIVSGYLYSENLQAVIIDSTGTVVAHPHKNYVDHLYNLLDKTRQEIQLSAEGSPILDADGYHQTIKMPAKLDDELSILAARVLAGNQGYVENIRIEDQLSNIYYKPAYFPGAENTDGYGILLIYNKGSLILFTRLLLLGVTLFISVCSLLLYLLFHRVFQSNILAPLGILIEAMKDSEIMNFEEIHIHTGDEFEMLATNYNQLRKDLADTHNHLQKRMKELEISEEGYRGFANIGLAMSGETDKKTVLEMIVRKGMDFCNAEGGTLYLFDSIKNELTFEIVFNDVLDIRQFRMENENEILMSIPLRIDSKPNFSNVSSYCAIVGEIINIPDVYHAEGFNFERTKIFDREIGYRSQSMIVIPMKNLEGKLLGVLQLINARDEEARNIIEFNDHHLHLLTVLASQGAITLTNIQLLNNLEKLFYSFISSIGTAIDEKSQFTSGHIKRVVTLSILIAEAINRDESGVFGGVHFSDEELEELRISAWMHDVGKISIPEDILDKSSKLMFSRDGMELVSMKARLIAALREADLLKQRLTDRGPGILTDEDRRQLAEQREMLGTLMNFIKNCNASGAPLSDEDVDRLKQAAEECAEDEYGLICLLSDEELHYLSIRRGTLDEDERKIIESHVAVTRKILEHLPFPEHLAHVPQYASQHHEKINGSGYDRGIKDNDLPLQSRIIAISDIFEALTADDRPYRKPLTLEKAVNIIEKMCDDNHLDRNLFNLLQETNIISRYMERKILDS